MPRDPVKVPPIPVALAHRPLTGGLVAPWVNTPLADGGVDFRSVHNSKWQRCWTEGNCQTCGEPLTSPVVLLGGPNQLAGYFTEPPLHPVCAHYAAAACPMVAGRMSHYPDREHLSAGQRGKACPEPGCDCGGWVSDDDGAGHGGDPAHEWWAVWARGWQVAVDPARKLLGGVPQGELRRCLISRPPTPGQEATR